MDQFKQWVADFLPSSVSLESTLTLQAVTGDAGFREYFRGNSSPAVIAVLAPPEHANNLAFIHKQQAFRAAGINVPRVYAVNFERGYMLQQDLGSRLLLDSLSPDNVDDYYDLAEAVLLDIQQMPTDAGVFNAYTPEALRNEMALFPEWFLSQLLGITLSDDDKQLLSVTFDQLITNALGQPQKIVHRDFHSRNLMLQEGNVTHCREKLSVIDFQDAVIGPLTYDLVSLLRDCYIRWPADYIYQRVANFRLQLERSGQLNGVSDTTFLRWFDLMGLQRHIKVLGIFARLYLRDGKPQYLNDLPLVFQYTMEQVEKYPELSAFADWLKKQVIPRLPEQQWYQPREREHK